jgi:PAS domain S-box-containing protein
MDSHVHTGSGLERVRRETAIPALIVDHQGLITYVNDAFVGAFGWARDEIVGRSISTIIPRALRDAHHLGFSRFLMAGTPNLIGRTLELPVLDRAGHEFAADHRIEAERTNGRWTFGATIEPKSDRPERGRVRRR